MRTSDGRVLTTHTGSLPRPEHVGGPSPAGAAPVTVASAVADVVARQRATGLDTINDGELPKASYVGYVTRRLTGLTGPATPRRRPSVEDFPGYARRQFSDPARAATLAQPSCDGPVRYVGLADLREQIGYLTDATRGLTDNDVFMNAASPGVIEMFMPNNGCYPDEEAYLYALADAMKTEYDEIARAGFLLQLDCPDLASGWEHGRSGGSVARFRDSVRLRLDVLHHATRDIPADRMRMHLCWGNFEGPHHHDLPLRHIIDLVLAARPAALCIEAANPRHEHEWEIFQDVTLPGDKILVPGVLDSTTNYIEHPELVAQRITRYADLVGRDRVIAGTDCGFATFAALPTVDPDIVWAKLGALVAGAELATTKLYRVNRIPVEPRGGPMNSRKDVALRMFAAMESQRVDDADEYIHAEFVHPETAQWSPERGPERFVANVRWLHSVFSDVHLDVTKLVEDGDRLYVQLVLSGRHTGDLFGMPPTNRSFFQEQMHIIDTKDGKAVHHQEWRNNLTALRQLGLVGSDR
jgi:5-methyltetrahydropteroyltriglutamate--homocysteine methyltransferase